MRFSTLTYLKLAVIGIAVFALAGFAWTGGRFGSPQVDNTFVGTLGSDAEREAVSVAAFNEAAKVFFSARCANCHPAGDVPTQGDEMTPHTMGVTRGKIGMGVYGQKCTTCHQNENLEGEHMPPGTSKPWHMPPASDPMPFQGLTAGQLCRNFKNPKHNGGAASAKEAMEHVQKRDPLVTWAWEPGNGRTTPPMSFEQFAAKVQEWVDNGGGLSGMKFLAESKGISKLSEIRDEFRTDIATRFEHRALPCAICSTPGVCCSDEHFVNVRVSALEAAAMRTSVNRLDSIARAAINERLKTVSPNAEFYACPLYQPGVGCLVHDTAKPLPCIAHACYDRKEDLPPDEMLSAREIEIDDLNRRVYGRSQPMMPIHAALR